MRNELVNKAVTLTVIIIISLAVLAMALWGIWEIAMLVPPNAARLWALVATALFPTAIAVTWRVATRYASGVVHGIDTGIDKVAKAGADAANLRVSITRALKETPPSPAVVLPQVEIVPRQLASGGQVINL